MAKRFTDTDKWKKPFIRSLEAPYKLLWFYILDDCSHAGIWEVDMEVASIRIGEKVTEEKALKFFGDRVVKIASSKWFLPDFVSFQYGELNEKNRLHLSVIQILNKHQIKGLIRPLEGPKEQYKDKDKDKVKDKDTTPPGEFKIPKNGNGASLMVPDMHKKFIEANPGYPADVPKDYPNLLEISEQILKWKKELGNIVDHKGMILVWWGKIVDHVKADSHLKKYSIAQINKHFQSIIQSLNSSQNGKSNSAGHAKPRSGKSAGAIELGERFEQTAASLRSGEEND